MNATVEDKIRPVLQSLQVLPERADILDVQAGRLAIVYALYRTQDTPGRRRAGIPKASRELVALANDLVAVHNRITELPLEARNALERQVQRTRERRLANEAAGIHQRRDHVAAADIFAIESLALANAAMEAERDLVATAETAPTPSRPKKHAAARVAEEAAQVFERLTGRAATVADNYGQSGGPFLQFVSALFEALDIQASPTSQAKKVQSERKKKRAG